nr:hypothetical protein 1 [bacterium]
MSLQELTLRQKILLSDAEHEHKGKQFTFRMSSTAHENFEHILNTERVPTAALLRVLIREGAKSLLGFDLEEQQAPAE